MELLRIFLKIFVGKVAGWGWGGWKGLGRSIGLSLHILRSYNLIWVLLYTNVKQFRLGWKQNNGDIIC